jgi:beta-galactosidase
VAGRERLGRRAVVIAVAGTTFVGASAAFAAFGDSGAVSHTIATATLAAPTNPATAHGPCVPSASASITVSWTATTSTWADGYEILGGTTAGGPYSVLATATGQGTTSRTIGNLAFSTTYYFVVKATKHGWRSAATAQVSRTTRTPLCT